MPVHLFFCDFGHFLPGSVAAVVWRALAPKTRDGVPKLGNTTAFHRNCSTTAQAAAKSAQSRRPEIQTKSNCLSFSCPPKWTFNDIYDATYGFRGFNGQLDSTPCLAATSSAFEARFRLERILGGPSIPAALRNSLVSRPNFPQTMHIKLSHIKIIKNAT